LIATLAAVGINVAVALASFALARVPRPAALESEVAEGKAQAEPEAAMAASEGGEPLWPVYVTIGISGACALGAEVVWTRLMGMLMGATVYVFSIILAVFLIGLAIGSSAGSWLLRVMPGARNARLALAWCQVLLTLGIAWTAWMVADSLPYWPINPMLTTSPWFTFQLDMARTLWALLPATMLWGASFPLALAAVAARKQDPGSVVGNVYAANTLGCIVGALAVSLMLIPWIGTQDSQRLLLVLSAASAWLLLVPFVWEHRSKPAAVGLAASMLGAGLLVGSIHMVPGELIAYGRKMAVNQGKAKVLYVVEGRNSSVAITQWNDGATEIDVNGHVEATTETYDMKLQRMVGHLPALLHPNPKSVLGIGFGAGVSAGTFTRYPGIQHITVCEIEPVIPPTSTRYFAKEDYEVYHNPRTRVIFDDARHYVMTTREKYDVIASDPLDVFVKGTAALYSKEYFEAIKAHLNPGGLFSLYVPLYETDERTIKSELATFFAAFPYGTVWANTVNGQGYDMVFMGQAQPLKIDLDEVQRRLESPDYAPVAQSLRDIGINSATELFATYAGQLSDLGPWVLGAELNRDGDLKLQYLGGWGINSAMEDLLYRQMMSYRQPPSNIFTGSPERLLALVHALNAQ
jgi:spermidine synthase